MLLGNSDSLYLGKENARKRLQENPRTISGKRPEHHPDVLSALMFLDLHLSDGKPPSSFWEMLAGESCGFQKQVSKGLYGHQLGGSL